MKLENRFIFLLKEFGAGLATAVIVLPSCLASGGLIFSALGPEYLSQGIAAAFYSVMFAIPVAALVAASSFIVASPRSDLVVIQASLIAYFLSNPALAGNTSLLMVALPSCLLLAGLFQIVFALVQIGRIIRFTPHPVLAGFVNGIGLLVIFNQIHRFVTFEHGFAIVAPVELAFILALVWLVLALHKRELRVPTSLVGLVVGIVVFYIFDTIGPDAVDLGGTIGGIPAMFPPAMPLSRIWDEAIRQGLVDILPQISLTALSLALVASLNTLLMLRNAQRLSGRQIEPVRDLVAQGSANCVAGLAGGVPLTLSSGVIAGALKAGSRTRLTGLVCAGAFIAVGMGFPAALGALPVAVISAMVITSGVAAFDRWSVGLTLRFVSGRVQENRRRAWGDLLVVGIVMAVTASGAVVEGVILGVILSCLIFIVRMARPIVSRMYAGDEVTSRRVRSIPDSEWLSVAHKRRVVLELRGVLFFGNADDLARTVRDMFDRTDVFILDFAEISDVDISGLTSLEEVLLLARRNGKKLMICNVSDQYRELIEDLFDHNDPERNLVDHDRDFALEAEEEFFLGKNPDRVEHDNTIALEDHDMLRGLGPDEAMVFQNCLVRQNFKAGDTICVEGEVTDRLWLITRGSVSVQQKLSDRAGSHRIVGLATGTVIGEIAFFDGEMHSATVIADGEVECYVLSRDAWNALGNEHASLALKILVNTLAITAHRLRDTSDHLRTMSR